MSDRYGMRDRYRGRTLRHVGVLAGLLLLASTGPSHAYVDPGSVSIVITAILGGLAAVGYTVRLYWARFKALFRRDEKKPGGQ